MNQYLDNKNKTERSTEHKHGMLYLLLGISALLFALLYIYGYILYTQ